MRPLGAVLNIVHVIIMLHSVDSYFMALVSVPVETMTEDLLILHEAEIESLKDYYRQNREMLEKVAKRQQLWEELLDLEVSDVWLSKYYHCMRNTCFKNFCGAF